MAAKKTKSEAVVPDRIFAQVSPKSIGGRSMFEAGELATFQNVQNYLSEKEVTRRAVEDLRNAGFEILMVTNFTINIAGSPEVYEKAFGQKIHAVEVESMKTGPEKDSVTFLDTTANDVLGLIEPRSGKLANYIEGVAIETPYYCFAPKSLPPQKSYWHLNVPADVSLGCNSERAHRGGTTGKGIHVAMVDTGFYRHPFYADRGYKVNQTVLAPGTTNPATDDNGHGTGEAANIFATAPDCNLTPVKWNFVNSKAAFDTAVALNPHIITCSWGSHNPTSISAAQQALGASIALAVSNGIVVVFSAGNGHWGYPGQHPDVISAGGVYLNENMALRASNYSSGFDSQIFPGRRVPDVCGLVGQSPGATYIMLPIQQGCEIDVEKAGGTHPAKDETPNNDGWAAFSGTSAAAPQLAGVAALIKQACGKLTPHQVRDIMKATAKDVTTGSSATGTTSVTGPDNSTGHGLVDAYKAVVRAKLRCRLVLPPVIPIQPILPVQPVVPIIPPVLPVNPVIPIPPVGPIPIGPVITVQPESAGGLYGENAPASEENLFLSSDEIDEIMKMADEGELDINDI